VTRPRQFCSWGFVIGQNLMLGWEKRPHNLGVLSAQVKNFTDKLYFVAPTGAGGLSAKARRLTDRVKYHP